VYPVTLGMGVLPLNSGVVDVTKAFYRTVQYPGTAAATNATTWTMDLGAGNTSAVITVGLTLGAGTNNLVVEQSADGSSWTMALTIPAFTSTTGQTAWYDLPLVSSQRAWRVRETVAGTTPVTAAQFGATPSEILMAKLNRDQYELLPNKSFQGRPLQYWFDKQIVPQLWLWPVPNDATTQIVLWTHNHVQDVGLFTNTLAVPQRWLNSIVWMLSEYMANEGPDVAPEQVTYCANMAMKAMTVAEMGESDGSPLQIAPNIRAYTR
jgi:hypothetical protein